MNENHFQSIATSIPIPLKTIGVAPPSALAGRPRLFAALSQAYPVVFTPLENGRSSVLDAALILGNDLDLAASLAAEGIPSLVMAAGGHDGNGPREIRFGSDPLLDKALRDQTLLEIDPPPFHPLAGREHDRPLALMADQPVWLHRPSGRSGYDIAGFGLDEFAPERCLRDESRGWRFLRHLPPHQFLRRLTADTAWQRPPLRAAFLIDDPNLHRQRYGYLDFEALAQSAREHHFHAVIATVPLDQWYVNRKVAALLRASCDTLSLTPHGNNHLHRELARPNESSNALRELAQALDRLRRMELKSGLNAARVMSPPHGVCSRIVTEAMSRLDFDAVTCSQPVPWLQSAPEEHPLTGWFCAEILSGYFPVLHRRSIPHCLAERAHRDELVMMTFLRQPIILCGHHPDLADKDALPSIAESINRRATVQWCDLTSMIQSNYETRLDGSVLHVRLFSRRVQLSLPEGVDAVVFEIAPGHAGHGQFRLSIEGHKTPGVFGEPVPVDSAIFRQDRTLSLRALSPDALSQDSLPMPRWTPQPYLRRVLTEARDRLAPLIGHTPYFH